MRISDWSSDVCSSDLWYWDGGLLSNTPLEHVVAAAHEDMLVFQVDLFPARGERPHDLEQAWSREKDIRYSSRTRRISDGLVRPEARAMASAILLFVQNLVGLGLGPLLFGMASEMLKPTVDR